MKLIGKYFAGTLDKYIESLKEDSFGRNPLLKENYQNRSQKMFLYIYEDGADLYGEIITEINNYNLLFIPKMPKEQFTSYLDFTKLENLI